MLTNDGKLDALVKQAMEAFNALTSEEQAAHWREQRISWAYGNLTCTGRREYITREMVEKEHDRLYGPGGKYEGK